MRKGKSAQQETNEYFNPKVKNRSNFFLLFFLNFFSPPSGKKGKTGEALEAETPINLVKISGFGRILYLKNFFVKLQKNKRLPA